MRRLVPPSAVFVPLALAILACASRAYGEPPELATFSATPHHVSRAAERSPRDARYGVKVARKGRAPTGDSRRATPTMKDQASAIEELRRISRFDPVQAPDTRAIAQYRVRTTVEVISLDEGRTNARVLSEIVTISPAGAGTGTVPAKASFRSLGVLEEETILRMREHLGEAGLR